MIAMFSARLLHGLAALAPVVLALQSIQASAQARLAPVQGARIVDDGPGAAHEIDEACRRRP